MKVAIITDTHFGARDGKEIFHSYYEKFYSKVFFPALRERGIKTLLHLGDVFDRRKYIDYYSLKRCREYFFEPLAQTKIKTHMLVGNHDIALRNSLEINSPRLLLNQYKNIHIIDEPQVVDFGAEKRILMCPWICSENQTQSLDLIRNSKADICCGHFEIAGFKMYRASEPAREGFDASLFKNYSLTMSGHYHTKTRQGNIVYLGNPYELTFMDCNDPRGFHILDFETKSLEFVENPYTMFEKFVYDDSKGNFKTKSVDISRFKEKFVKIIVERKTDFYEFDLFLNKLYNESYAFDIKIIDITANTNLYSEETALDSSVDIQNTQTILNHYIEKIELEDPLRDRLKKFMNSLYVEALHNEK